MNPAVMNALRTTGLAGLYSALVAPAGAVVLMYHSVADDATARCIDPANRLAPREFEQQMEFLASRRVVVAMDQVADCARGRIELAPGSVAITFDDGYLDNLTIAAPILRRLRLPATLYLPTAYIDAGEAQWIDRVHWAMTSFGRGEIELPGVFEGTVDVSSGRARTAITGALRRSALGARNRVLTELERRLGTKPPSARTTMTWDDVRTLSRDFPDITIGAHTVTHRDMSECPAEESAGEIVGSLDDIERATGARPHHFSFPYGRISEAGVRAAKRAGLRSCVGAGALPRARDGCDPFRLARVPAPERVPDLESLTHPAYPDLPLTLLGRV